MTPTTIRDSWRKYRDEVMRPPPDVAPHELISFEMVFAAGARCMLQLIDDLRQEVKAGRIDDAEGQRRVGHWLDEFDSITKDCHERAMAELGDDNVNGR